MAKKAELGTSIRKSVRFTSDPLMTAIISYKSKVSFKPENAAIVLNESFTGCALLLKSDDGFTKDQDIVLKLGDFDPKRAKIVWVKNLEENIYKIGIKWL